MPGRIYSLLSCLVMMFGFGSSSDGFNKEDIRFARFFKAATQTTRKALAEVFGLLFHRYGVWTTVEAWPPSVAVFCSELLEWTDQQYCTTFTEDERKEMDKPLISAHLDVTFLVKMIDKLFTDFKLPLSFKRAVWEIKCERNRVCHKELAINEAELGKYMDDLKQLLENLFDETGHFFNVDVTKLKPKYLHEIDKITCTPIMDEDEERIQFQEELVGKFITQGRKELMAYYSKLKILNPFSWMSDETFPELLLDKVFTPLHIKEQGRSIDFGSLLITELMDPKTQKSLKILPSVMIMYGVAGCGKTSLCRYILYDWQNRLGGVRGLRPIDVVIFIEIRNVEEGSFVPFLKKTLLRETCRLFNEEDIVNTLQEMNVLYVIDGMDEATKKGRDLVHEVFSCIGTARIIITTRPEFMPEVERYALQYRQQYLKLHIQGFTMKGIKTFSSKILRSCEPDEAKWDQMEGEFFNYLKTTGRALGDHLKLPLTLALLVLLWKNDKSFVSNITTSASLYLELFKFSIMKLICRLQTKSELHDIELEKSIWDWLELELGKEAYEMLKVGLFVLEGSKKEHLFSSCKKHRIDPMQTMSAFLICEEEEHSVSTNYSFTFTHKSQMEYLASLFIVKHLTEKDSMRQKKESTVVSSVQRIVSKGNEISLELKSSKTWLNTILFTLGNLCREKCVSDFALLELTDILIKFKSHDIATAWNTIQESYLHPVVTKAICGSFNTNYIWKPDCDSLSNPVDPAMMMILKTELRPRGAIIRIIDSMNSTKITVEEHVEKRAYTNNLYQVVHKLSASPRMNVALRLDQHYYRWGNAETSDKILMSLLPGGWLMAFMGHLATEGAKAFSSVTRLSEGCVRVSDMSVLQTLAESLATNAANKIIKRFTIRLDVPPLTLVPSLPMINMPVELSIILYGIGDESVAWAAQLIATLRQSYKEIDLVTSCLTPAGGESFLIALRTKCILVTGVLTIRSTHGIEEAQHKVLEEMVQGQLEWLW